MGLEQRPGGAVSRLARSAAARVDVARLGKGYRKHLPGLFIRRFGDSDPDRQATEDQRSRSTSAYRTVAGSTHPATMAPTPRTEEPHRGDTASHQWKATAGVGRPIRGAHRRSHRVHRVVLGAPVGSRNPRRGGGKPRLPSSGRRPDVSVMPSRELLHGRTPIRLHGELSRGHMESARQADFARQRARFRVMPDGQLLPGSGRARRIRLRFRRRQVEFGPRHRRSCLERSTGHGIGIVLVAQLLRRR